MMWRHVWACVGIVLLCHAQTGLAQQEMRSATKGASTPLPITGTAIDANHNGLDVNIVGGAGGGGGGTQYTEDVASAGGESLTLSGAVRRDTAASSATTDGDYATINTDATGRLWTNTELPDAAAASDSFANPTAPSVIAMLMCYDGATWLRQPRVSDTDAIGVSGNNCRTATMGWNFNGTSWDRNRGAVNALNSVGTGIQAAQIVGQFDDTSPTAITENQFGNLRMSANRNLYGTIRDAAGNERGANVNSSNELLTNANTELPAAAALADTTSNPTVPGVGSYNMCWNGSTWDRCTKATAGNGAVDTATQRVTIANDSTGNLATIGTSITPGTSAAHLGKAEDGAHTTGDTGVMLLGVRAASPTDRSAGPTDGDYEPLGINAAGAVWTTPTPTTAGGLTTHYLTSAASTNSTNVKNAAGQVYLIRAVNTTSTLYYLRMYNASAAPTCSSATNFIETIPIPASASGAGIVIPQYMGQTYATGISYCLTGGGSSTDNTNAATGVYLTILYK